MCAYVFSCRFGWLGLNKDIPPHIVLNYIGVLFCLIRCLWYAAVTDTETVRAV